MEKVSLYEFVLLLHKYPYNFYIDSLSINYIKNHTYFLHHYVYIIFSNLSILNVKENHILNKQILDRFIYHFLVIIISYGLTINNKDSKVSLFDNNQ